MQRPAARRGDGTVAQTATSQPPAPALGANRFARNQMTTLEGRHSTAWVCFHLSHFFLNHLSLSPVADFNGHQHDAPALLRGQPAAHSNEAAHCPSRPRSLADLSRLRALFDLCCGLVLASLSLLHPKPNPTSASRTSAPLLPAPTEPPCSPTPPRTRPCSGSTRWSATTGQFLMVRLQLRNS
jgi:hypothetical protein